MVAVVPLGCYAGAGNKERLTAGSSDYQNTALGVTTQTGTGAATVIREPSGTPVALRTGGASYYYIADRQGSTIALVDATGIEKNSYTYDPYGVSRTKTETVVNPWQYIGAQLDGTGLYHLQARYYDPTIGRFTQPDTSGQEANAYAYAADNPASFSDPTGLFPTADAVEAGISIAFAIIGYTFSGSIYFQLALAVVQTAVGTAVDCLFGCDRGVPRTALTNAILGFFSFATSGLLSDALQAAGYSVARNSTDVAATLAGIIAGYITRDEESR